MFQIMSVEPCSLCASTSVWMCLHTVQFHRKWCMLLYVTPLGVASQVLACVCIYAGVWESEREVYLCVLKGVRVSTASHCASLCSPFVWASACQAVWVCTSACVYAVVCMSVTERRREAAKCVCDSDRTRQPRVMGVHSFLPWVPWSLVWTELQPITGWLCGAGKYRKQITNIRVGKGRVMSTHRGSKADMINIK